MNEQKKTAEMALERLTLAQYNRPVYGWVTGTVGELDLTPTYQRGSVWTTTQRVALIQSLLQGLPIGAVFLNRRGEHDPTFHVVDGKQRIETVLMFARDELAVPGWWFTDEDLIDGFRDVLPLVPRGPGRDEVAFSDLSKAGQMRFKLRAVATYETTLPTEADELDLYLRINTGGTAHTARDLARAQKGH